jgi:hypothetical protein
MRSGDFTDLPPSITLTDPATGLPFTPTNIIPQARLSKVSVAVQDKYFPSPN